MKKTIVKNKEAKNWFFERINKTDKLYPDSSRKKERKLKSIKLEMKKENLQRTP